MSEIKTSNQKLRDRLYSPLGIETGSYFGAQKRGGAEYERILCRMGWRDSLGHLVENIVPAVKEGCVPYHLPIPLEEFQQKYDVVEGPEFSYQDARPRILTDYRGVDQYLYTVPTDLYFANGILDYYDGEITLRISDKHLRNVTDHMKSQGKLLGFDRSLIPALDEIFKDFKESGRTHKDLTALQIEK